MRGLFRIGVAVVAASAVIGGLMFTGGPEAARQAEADEKRAQALRNVRGTLECNSPLSAFPETPTEGALREYCSSGVVYRDILDPETKEPFRLARIGDDRFEVCATFHDPDAPDWGAYKYRAPVTENLRGEGVYCLEGRLRLR